MKSPHGHNRDGQCSGNAEQGELRLATTDLSVKSGSHTGLCSTSRSLHKRNESLHVTWTEPDIVSLAKELSDQTIAEVHLSLLGYWIRDSDEHYEIAKKYIRELALDQGYNVERIHNIHLRTLLVDVHTMRPKEPRHAAAMKRHISMANARRSPQSTLNLSPSSPTSPSERVKDWVQAGKENSSRVNMRSISAALQAGSIGDYPPNTPDRPAPLRFRSFSSNTAVSTPTTNHSVTSPFSDRFALDTSSPSLPRNNALLEDTASHPLLTPNVLASASSTKKDTDDVFGIVHESPIQQSDGLNEKHATEGGLRDESKTEDLSSNPETDTATDGYQLDEADVESDGSYETIDDDDSEHSHDDAPVNDHLEDKDSLDASGDEISVLETVSNASDVGIRTQYYFSSRRAASETTLTETTLDTPEVPVVSPKYSKHNKLFPHNHGKDYERPLPLRDFIEKQEALKTVKAGKFSKQKLASPTTGARRKPLKTKEAARRTTKKRLSRASTLLAFPIPPLQFPISELPMAIMRATLPTDHDNVAQGAHESKASLSSPMSPTTASRPATAISATDYKTHIQTLLARTRAHGATLPLISWNSLNIFERLWREQNKELLERVYGRNDIELSEMDVRALECIAKEVKEGGAIS